MVPFFAILVDYFATIVLSSRWRMEIFVPLYITSHRHGWDSRKIPRSYNFFRYWTNKFYFHYSFLPYFANGKSRSIIDVYNNLGLITLDLRAALLERCPPSASCASIFCRFSFANSLRSGDKSAPDTRSLSPPSPSTAFDISLSLKVLPLLPPWKEVSIILLRKNSAGKGWVVC